MADPRTAERPRLVLASASPARLALLQAAGIDPEVIASGVDEDAFTEGTTRERCLMLAAAKAEAVALAVDARSPAGATAGDVLVLGCDSLLELDGETLGKPADASDVLERWRRMSGQSGTLHTGHCLIHTGLQRRAAEVSSTVVRFGQPTDAELAAYVDSGEPLRVAGAFTIDGRGAAFVESIDGDPGTVVGLSPPVLRRLLAELDVPIVSLWSAP